MTQGNETVAGQAGEEAVELSQATERAKRLLKPGVAKAPVSLCEEVAKVVRSYSRVAMTPTEVRSVLELHPQQLVEINESRRARKDYLQKAVDVVSTFMCGRKWPEINVGYGGRTEQEKDKDLMATMRKQAVALGFKVIEAKIGKKQRDRNAEGKAPGYEDSGDDQVALLDGGIRGQVADLIYWLGRGSMAVGNGIRKSEDALKLYEAAGRNRESRRSRSGLSSRTLVKLLGYDPKNHAGMEELKALQAWCSVMDKQTYWSLTSIEQGLALMRVGMKSMEDDKVEMSPELKLAAWRHEALGMDPVLKAAVPAHPAQMLQAAEVAFKGHKWRGAKVMKVGRWKASSVSARWHRSVEVKRVADIPVTEALRFVVEFDAKGNVASSTTELDV